MELWDIRKEINKAKSTLRNADTVANEIADILPGRLRHVSNYNLKKLKMELKDYNAHTGKWKGD